MSNYKAVFKCIAGCDEEYPLDEIVYNCKKCGNLLEVKHNTESLKDKTATQWKELFKSRVGTTQWPYASGVWGKKELILPGIDSENIVSMCEGNTNMFWLLFLFC